MANVQATMRGQSARNAPPNECIGRSNALLYQSTSSEKFVTLFIVCWISNSIRYVSAMRARPSVSLQRLAEVIRSHRELPASEIIDTIVSAVHAHAAGAVQSDDMTIVIVKRIASA